MFFHAIWFDWKDIGQIIRRIQGHTAQGESLLHIRPLEILLKNTTSE
jgi:hypothetical protein